jgi:hybrid polyketide synthase/nonribosomal peptide synthetase ACE1
MEAIELALGDEIVELPWNGTIAGRVDEVANRQPEAVAIKYEDGQNLTYTQMRERNSQIVYQLHSLPPGSYVAMLL